MIITAKTARSAAIAGMLAGFILCQSSFSASWEEIYSLAEKNNEGLRIAEKNLEAMEWQYKKSLTSFLPQLSASAGYGKTDTGGASSTSTSYGLSATQSLFSGFGNMNASKKAYALLEYSRADLVQKKADALYAVRSAFIDLVIAEKDLALQEQILARRLENAKLIDLLYNSGKEDKGNMLLTHADVESSRASVSQAERALDLARLNLSQLVGALINKADLRGTTPYTKESIDINALAQNSPSYSMASYTYDAAEISADEALASLLPDLSATGTLRRSGSEWPPQTESSTWNISLSYSFFPGGSNIAEKVIKEIEKEKAAQSLEQTKKDILYLVSSSYNSLANRLETLKVKTLYLNAATERARIARTKYINGLMSYDEWDRTENSYITAEKDFLSSQKDAYVAEAAFKKSYGGWVQ
jgi:outer membrane protein